MKHTKAGTSHTKNKSTIKKKKNSANKSTVMVKSKAHKKMHPKGGKQ